MCLSNNYDLLYKDEDKKVENIGAFLNKHKSMHMSGGRKSKKHKKSKKSKKSKRHKKSKKKI